MSTKPKITLKELLNYNINKHKKYYKTEAKNQIRLQNLDFTDAELSQEYLMSIATVIFRYDCSTKDRFYSAINRITMSYNKNQEQKRLKTKNKCLVADPSLTSIFDSLTILKSNIDKWIEKEGLSNYLLSNHIKHDKAIKAIEQNLKLLTSLNQNKRSKMER